MFGQPSTPFGGGFGQQQQQNTAPAFGSPPPSAGLPTNGAPPSTGFGVSNTSFGAPAQPQVGGLFGSTSATGSGFGGTGFGVSNTSFGAPAQPQAGGLFGSTSATGSGFGGGEGFGAPVQATLGAPAPSAFGSQAPAGGGLFRSSMAPTPAVMGEGAAGGGTRAFPYQVTKRQDQNGASIILLHDITAMPQYENKFPEELRFEDYSQGKRDTAAPASGVAFGAPAPAPTGGLFGAQSAGFGGSTFGSPAPASFGAETFAAPTPGGLFGSQAPDTAFSFGGTPAPATGGGLFGAPAPTSTFGSPSSAPAFGSMTAPAPFGIFAFGSAGTLNIGLGSCDLANVFMNGLTLSTTNRLNEGQMPNSQLGMQLPVVNNFSSEDMCCVEQNLRFHYKDIDQLPKVLEGIVQEIKDACPSVITDGSHPLRAVFMNYREDHLQVVVTAHFHCKAMGQEYYNTHQSCLFAINNAVKKNNVQFMMTSIPW